jgi:hypothetical protein
MRKSLFLHIGAHKTGTTALQRSFTENAELAKQAGVFYPKTNWYYFAQHRLPFAMKALCIPPDNTIPDLAVEVADLVEAANASGCQNILVSSEEFFACPPAAIDQLKAALPDWQVTILAFTRRPDNLLISSYNQKTKDPDNAFYYPIAEYLDDPVSLDPDLDQAGCIANWAEVFGHDALRLMRYEDAQPLSVVRELLGCADLPFKAPVWMNRSVSAPVIEIMRLSKAAGWPMDAKIKLFSASKTVFGAAPGIQLADLDRLRVIRHFEAANTALFARCGLQNTYTTAAFQPTGDDPEASALRHRDWLQLVAHLLD